MKVILTSILIGLIFVSCSTSKSSINPKGAELNRLTRNDYNVLQTTEGIAKSDRVWLLFIPLGGKTDERLYEIAYNNGVESLRQDADGILEPRYEYKKITIPLILISYVHKKVKVKGKAYRLKTDSEKKN